MSQFWCWVLVAAAFSSGCAAPAVPVSTSTTESVVPGRFSIEGMTAAVMDIEAALGEDRARSLREMYEREYRADPTDPFKRFLWAYSLDDRNRAWEELIKITKLNDRFYWAFLGMGVILDGWKVDDQAETSLRRALELDSRIAIGHGRLGKMYLRKNRTEEALVLLRKAVERDPRQVVYQLDLARALEQAGKSREALDAYRQVLEEDASQFAAHAEMAVLLSHMGEKQAAAESYARAAALDDGAYQVRFTRSQLLAELGEEEEALTVLQEACRLRMDELVCWQTLAALAGRVGKEEILTNAFEQILRIDNKNIQAHKFLAGVYLQAGEIERALPSFHVVLEQEKGNLEALSGLARIYEQGGEFSRAIEYNQKIIERQEDHPEARRALERLFERFNITAEPIGGKNPDQVFSRNRLQIAEVYKLRLKERPGIRGELHYKVSVSNEGEVVDLAVVKNTLGDVVIDLCAFWNLKRSRFPGGFGASYDFELTLKPGE